MKHLTMTRQGAPCQPVEALNKTAQHFSSGDMDTDLKEWDEHASPVFQVKVNDTDPIWFYCSAPSSCNVYKMIGVINAVRAQ